MGSCTVSVIVLRVLEFGCPKCKVLVLKAICKLIGICKIEIDAEKSTVTVTGEVDPVAVVKQIRKVGKMVEIVTVGPPPKEPEKEQDSDKPIPFPSATCEHISIKFQDYGGCAIM